MKNVLKLALLFSAVRLADISAAQGDRKALVGNLESELSRVQMLEELANLRHRVKVLEQDRQSKRFEQEAQQEKLVAQAREEARVQANNDAITTLFCCGNRQDERSAINRLLKSLVSKGIGPYPAHPSDFDGQWAWLHEIKEEYLGILPSWTTPFLNEPLK